MFISFLVKVLLPKVASNLILICLGSSSVLSSQVLTSSIQSLYAAVSAINILCFKMNILPLFCYIIRDV
jgi:hypothetical protein